MPIVFVIFLIQMFLCLVFIAATPIVIHKKLQERAQKREAKRQKDYFDC